MKKIVATVAASVGALSLLAGPPAAADHVHSKQVGNEQCVLLAQTGGEGQVQLPGSDEFPENRRHPLHVKVHLGQPGQNFPIGVYGTLSDPCFGESDDTYLNLHP